MMPIYGRDPAGYLDNLDADVRRRRFFVRLAIIAFVCIVVFFGIRGSFGIWNTSSAQSDCPSRIGWMASDFVCQNPRQTPIKAIEPFPLFKVLTLDCTLTPPSDMSAIQDLCCASTKVLFARVQTSLLEFENSTTIRIRGADMANVFAQAKSAICTADEPCATTCPS